ncbi:hypothetical protein HanRHA438_Chr15g0713361 [Helianthus annuus]|nr:hypothetical protein HanRHA438_Chr15g0713361 [Helianthus annuus]
MHRMSVDYVYKKSEVKSGQQVVKLSNLESYDIGPLLRSFVFRSAFRYINGPLLCQRKEEIRS